MTINEILNYITSSFNDGRKNGLAITQILTNITSTVKAHDYNVQDKVAISKKILELMTEDDRIEICKKLLKEQVTNQRDLLNVWSTITAQSSQIDTGYIAQHLCSLRTQIPGQGMRGKGDDLSDGSEVKSANFLDSLDKKGATAPRWNFTAVTPEIMYKFLNYTSLYLLSIDLNKHKKIRIRIWQVDVTRHTELKNRYTEWIKIKGEPKFAANKNESVNFQLFPPKMYEDCHFARHGNNRSNGFPSIEIDLENGSSSKLIFSAIQEDDEFNVIFY